MTFSPSAVLPSRWMLLWLAVLPLAGWAADRPVYRCPGKPVLYTSELGAKEARDKGCTTLEGTPITVIGMSKPAGAAGGGAKPASAASGTSRGERVDPGEQRVRDNDARKILEIELSKEEAALAALKKDYNNGEPERRGEERNYQRYVERVAEMKAAVARKEADVAALRRELAKVQ
jgi:hypothetical protein